MPLAQAAEDGDDLAEDLGLVPVDRVEGGVVGEELDVAAPAGEVLDRGLGLVVGEQAATMSPLSAVSWRRTTT